MTLLCSSYLHNILRTHDFITVKSNWDAEEKDKMPDDVVLANMRLVFVLLY